MLIYHFAKLKSREPRAAWIQVERGAAAVELAVALPIILLIAFGLVQVMLVQNVKTIIDHAAAEGARVAAVSLDRGDGVRAARAVCRALPRGSGLVSGRPVVKIIQGPERVRAIVKVRISLLPFVSQVGEAGASRAGFILAASSTRRREPYAGF